MCDSERQEYYEYLNRLQDVESKQYGFYDKALLTLSAGALVLSTSFIDNVIGDKQILHVGLLKWSWYSWTSCILSILLSSVFSILGVRRARKQYLYGQRDGVFGGIWDKLVAVFNSLNMILFFAGVLFMTIFASQNLEERLAMPRTNGDNATKGDRTPQPNPPPQKDTTPPPNPPPPKNDS